MRGSRTQTLAVVNKRILIAENYTAALQDSNSKKDCPELFRGQLSDGQVSFTENDVNEKSKKRVLDLVLEKESKERKNVLLTCEEGLSVFIVQLSACEDVDYHVSK